MHNFILYSLWGLAAIIFIIELWAWLYFFEYHIAASFHHQPPFVPTSRSNQKKLVKYINENYPNAKLICEIGSGHGRLARYIAKHTGANVIGLENMFISAMIAKIEDLFQTKSKTVKCDAFEYLKTTTKKFDIAIAYLGPYMTPKLLKYKDKFKTLISLDFEITDYKPTKVVNYSHGNTLYNHKLYPHRLYIYEF